jgi:hypothetical protein
LNSTLFAMACRRPANHRKSGAGGIETGADFAELGESQRGFVHGLSLRAVFVQFLSTTEDEEQLFG